MEESNSSSLDNSRIIEINLLLSNRMEQERSNKKLEET